MDLMKIKRQKGALKAWTSCSGSVLNQRPEWNLRWTTGMDGPVKNQKAKAKGH